jgi:hypothetical protein
MKRAGHTTHREAGGERALIKLCLGQADLVIERVEQVLVIE